MRLLKRSYILFNFVENSEPLTGVWPRLDAVEKKGILARLALLLGKLHLFGGVHGDLKWNNILVNGQGALFLIDLDGSKIVGPGKYRRKRKDLDRFLVDLQKQQSSEKDLAAFLDCWERWI
jgi:tRNA A-37 threonylcarbamoyl transferase component Bud32